MAVKVTRLRHKIAIHLHLVVESCTICSSCSRRSVRKLLDTLSCNVSDSCFPPFQVSAYQSSLFEPVTMKATWNRYVIIYANHFPQVSYFVQTFLLARQLPSYLIFDYGCITSLYTPKFPASFMYRKSVTCWSCNFCWKCSPEEGGENKSVFDVWMGSWGKKVRHASPVWILGISMWYLCDMFLLSAGFLNEERYFSCKIETYVVITPVCVLCAQLIAHDSVTCLYTWQKLLLPQKLLNHKKFLKVEYISVSKYLKWTPEGIRCFVEAWYFRRRV
jgi:hypothetical protein